MSTFSKLRVGPKRTLAGSAALKLIVPAAATGVIGQLPAGSILLAVSANEASLEVTISAAYGTNLTPGVVTPILAVELASDTDVNVTTAGTAAGLITVEYVLADPKNGVNE